MAKNGERLSKNKFLFLVNSLISLSKPNNLHCSIFVILVLFFFLVKEGVGTKKMSSSTRLFLNMNINWFTLSSFFYSGFNSGISVTCVQLSKMSKSYDYDFKFSCSLNFVVL